MSRSAVPPSWRLPEGVNASLWEYTHTPRLAAEEDEYFRGHPLFATDARELEARFVEPAPLVDLGCGTGRHALQFARRGFPVVAVDLSHAMLQAVEAKARAEGLPLLAVEANLCRLGAFPDATFGYALSMFSTLGMIRGRPARRKALAEAFRILQPGGRLALHVHNVWLNLRDPKGRAWLLGQGLRALLFRPGVFDRRMTYRGITGMEVHLYRWGELRRDLHSAGFLTEDVVPVHAVSARPIPFPTVAHQVRAGGWLVFCRRPG